VAKGTPFVHKGFISALYCDAPARAKLLCTVGSFTAYLACIACRLTGTPKAGVMRYLGYNEPVLATEGPGAGRSYSMRLEDSAARRYTADEVEALMEAAEVVRQEGGTAVGKPGFHGKSPLLSWLPYLTIHDAAVIPFAHAFCQGVVKDFFKAIFAPFPQPAPQQPPQPQPTGPAGLGAAAPLPKRRRIGGGAKGAPVLPAEKLVPHRQRRIIKMRAAGWKTGLHPQKNRPYRDIVKYKVRRVCGQSVQFSVTPRSHPPPTPLTFTRHPTPSPQGAWLIDDVAQGLGGLLAPVFWPVTDERGHAILEVLPDPHIKKAYGHLRRFAEFHLGAHEFETNAEMAAAATAAHLELLEYAKLAELVRDKGGRGFILLHRFQQPTHSQQPGPHPNPFPPQPHNRP
jgi:hypothetical protein